MAALKTYRAKRRFEVSAEPRGSGARKRGHAFVIQKHAARRLHYDLRLELDGVMKSWAVTRGPSLVPDEKRLAVQVEDHPIDYNKFEGTIPKGEYGGGTVMIWDRGSWQPEGDPHKGLAKGHLNFALRGEKLQGNWHLVRMHRKSGEKRDNWLLVKAHDDAERRVRDGDILEEEPFSVTTGRNMDEIAEGTPKQKGKRRTARARSQRTIPKAKSARAPRTLVRALQSKSGAVRSKSSVAKDKHAPLPNFIEPCLATLSEKAPEAGNWIHEIKFDGYRLQARLKDGRVTLRTRRGLDWTTKFPSAAAAVGRLPADTALLDGELV